MSAGFILALVSILLGWRRGGYGLLTYTAACIWIVASSGSGWLNIISIILLLICNGLVWIWLRGFARSEIYPAEEDTGARQNGNLRIILPVTALLFLEFVITFSAASLGLGPLLGIGLVLASLCIVACGGVLAQFQGLFMAADALAVLACLLSSCALLGFVVALWSVLALLGFLLLPRLVWRRVDDDDGNHGDIIFHDADPPDLPVGVPLTEQPPPDLMP